VLASLHGLRVGPKRLRNTVMLILFTVVALASKSATSFITLFSFCGMDGITTLLFRRRGAARICGIFAFLFLMPLVTFAAIFPDSLLEMIGKDPTLTGRTDLWDYVLIYIHQRPWLGWGYSAFWSPSNLASVEISEVLQWHVPQAHNGLLEMLLNAGFVGTAFFIFLWVRNSGLALRCLHTPQKGLAISTLLACGGILLVGISETILMEPLQISTTIFFVTGLMCERALQAERRRRSTALRRLTRVPVRARTAT
jgi:exopolysaccharide production protein ExoQ